MQYNIDTETQLIENKPLVSSSKKTQKVRRWREIEELKSRRDLLKELQDIDPSFNFSLHELI
mgnify:CR=1 FL=1